MDPDSCNYRYLKAVAYFFVFYILINLGIYRNKKFKRLANRNPLFVEIAINKPKTTALALEVESYKPKTTALVLEVPALALGLLLTLPASACTGNTLDFFFA